MAESPIVVVIGGPNGAGKTTISHEVVKETLGIGEFVNADDIARGLSGFEPERAAIQAGRTMLLRLHELAAARSNFAFETTMASRTFAPWLAELTQSGYEFHATFVWLRSPRLAIQRVHARVRRGGHFVPPEVVRRRYGRGIANFINLYLPLASQWRVYDNSGGAPIEVVHRLKGESPAVFQGRKWNRILEIAREETHQDHS